MPIYEFYCTDCHMIFNFFSRRVNTTKRPSCPRCGRQELKRKLSLFAISKGRREEDKGDELPGFDEEHMERVLGSLVHDAEAIDENDPKAIAEVMRKLYGATGLKLGPGMKEVICRLEAGEDPDRIEEDMGSLLEEDPFALSNKVAFRNIYRRSLPPEVDETLYEL